MKEVDWISSEDWEVIVSQVPIVSVDLIVLTDGGVLLGERENEPAKGYWFVPGGRVHKGESLVDAVHRIATEELGTEVKITNNLGAYEHFYDSSDVSESGGKHYLANGFVVKPLSSNFETDSQHSKLEVFRSSPDNLHEYTNQYLQDIEELPSF